MTSDSHCGTVSELSANRSTERADCESSQGYCFTALHIPSAQAINYTFVVPTGGRQLGWYGVAQRTQMVGS